jgi:hypothetical protein
VGGSVRDQAELERALAWVELKDNPVKSVGTGGGGRHRDILAIKGQFNICTWSEGVALGSLEERQIGPATVCNTQSVLDSVRPLPIGASRDARQCASRSDPKRFRDVHIRLSLNLWDGFYPWPFNARNVGL